MNDPFFSRFVEGADRLQNRGFGFRLIRFKSSSCLVDGSPSGATDIAITQAAVLVLTVSFDLRLNVSQGFSPNYSPGVLREISCLS